MCVCMCLCVYVCYACLGTYLSKYLHNMKEVILVQSQNKFQKEEIPGGILSAAASTSHENHCTLNIDEAKTARRAVKLLLKDECKLGFQAFLRIMT